MELFWRRGAIFALTAMGLTFCVWGLRLAVTREPAAGLLGCGAGAFLLLAAMTWFNSQRPSHWLSLAPLLTALSLVLLAQSPLWGSAAALLGIATLTFSLLSYLGRTRSDQRTLLDSYRSAVVARRIRANDQQLELVRRLDQLARTFRRYETRRRLPWAFLLRPPRGIYLHGPAGRGKSFLLDGLYDTLGSRARQRFHYHQLMGRLTDALHAVQVSRLEFRWGSHKGFRAAARRLAQPGSLVFVDELNLVDLGGARLLGPLLNAWWRDGCVLCISSNLPPERLLARVAVESELRERLVRAIDRHMEVWELAGPEDYRREKLSAADLYQTPITVDSVARLEKIVRMLAEDAPIQDPVQFGNRALPCRARATGVAWFTFDDLCGRPFGFRDYLTLVEQYPNLVVSDVPALHEEDPARRFAWLVELVYDAKQRLILSAEVPVDQLFATDLSSTGEETDFGKIQSRLLEMQSSEYNYVLAGETE